MRYLLPAGSPGTPQPLGPCIVLRASGTTMRQRCPGGEDRLPLRLRRASGTTSEVLAGAPPARRTAREAMI